MLFLVCKVFTMMRYQRQAYQKSIPRHIMGYSFEHSYAGMICSIRLTDERDEPCEIYDQRAQDQKIYRDSSPSPFSRTNAVSQPPVSSTLPFRHRSRIKPLRPLLDPPDAFPSATSPPYNLLHFTSLRLIPQTIDPPSIQASAMHFARTKIQMSLAV